MDALEKEIQKIHERNKRVEQDKAWERSWTRRIFITILTYGGAYLFLRIVHVENAELAAVVPATGYWLSQLGISPLRKIWEKFSHF